MTSRDAATEPADTTEVASDEGATPATVEAEASVPATDTGKHAAAATEIRRGRRRRRHAADEEPTGADGSGDADDEGSAADTGDTGKAARTTRAARRAKTADGDDATAPRRRRRWPLVAMVVVAALFAGAMVGLFTLTRPDDVAGLSRPQQAALDAASQAAVNLQTFRRASFDQDFANALASLTPDYGTEQFAPRKDALGKQLTAGGRDTSASVLSAGLVSATATQAVVLVVTTTVQTADDGTSTPFVFSRLQLSLQLLDGKWLVSDLKSVGLS